jgi:hypothetical protein
MFSFKLASSSFADQSYSKPLAPASLDPQHAKGVAPPGTACRIAEFSRDGTFLLWRLISSAPMLGVRHVAGLSYHEMNIDIGTH